jgi:ABC-type uncharacterized transport system permease subunit
VSESLLKFLESHPFWAVFVIIFMILPIMGAVVHIILKAFGHRGLDNMSSFSQAPPAGTRPNGGPDKDDNLPLDSR